MDIIGRIYPQVTYSVQVTTSDSAGSFNLINNGNHAKFIQNKGTSGLILIRQRAAAAGRAPNQAPAGVGDSQIFLSQGQIIEVADSWENVYTTGTQAGAVIEAFYRVGK